MIVTKFYKGQGLGNQLWVYATLRSIAWRHGYEFGIESKTNFKLRNILKIDLGRRVYAFPHERPYGWKPISIRNVVFEKEFIEIVTGFRVGKWQDEIESIEDNTKIEGYFQSLKYIGHFRYELTTMLQCNFAKPIEDGACLINVRGGDYLGNKDICLDKNYYTNAINLIREQGIFDFKIVTDDVSYAERILPGIPIISVPVSRGRVPTFEEKIAWDFSSLQQSTNLILSNSTFCWWAAWTNTNLMRCIAPKYWAYPRNQLEFWSPQDIVVNEWMYLDQHNKVAPGYESSTASGATLNLQFSGTLKQKLDLRIRTKVYLYRIISKFSLMSNLFRMVKTLKRFFQRSKFWI